MFRSSRRSARCGLSRVSRLAFLISCLSAATPALAQPSAAAGAAPAANPAEVIARGRYLVEDVAMCWRCHSPVDVRGVRDRSHWLMGGQVATKSMIEAPGDWAIIAPRLAGAPPGTDAQFVTLLTTGVSRTGRAPRQPMPPFRLTRADAEAVLAYLKSLGGRAAGPNAAAPNPPTQ